MSFFQSKKPSPKFLEGEDTRGWEDPLGQLPKWTGAQKRLSLDPYQGVNSVYHLSLHSRQEPSRKPLLKAQMPMKQCGRTQENWSQTVLHTKDSENLPLRQCPSRGPQGQHGTLGGVPHEQSGIKRSPGFIYFKTPAEKMRENIHHV